MICVACQPLILPTVVLFHIHQLTRLRGSSYFIVTIMWLLLLLLNSTSLLTLRKQPTLIQSSPRIYFRVSLSTFVITEWLHLSWVGLNLLRCFLSQIDHSETCKVCDGLEVQNDVVIPGTNGLTCEFLVFSSESVDATSNECIVAQLAQSVCCGDSETSTDAPGSADATDPTRCVLKLL